MSNDRIERWLVDWSTFLDLWLESGTDAPGATAYAATKHWRDQLPSQGFETVAGQLEVLIQQQSSRADRARALLDLLAWHRAAERLQL